MAIFLTDPLIDSLKPKPPEEPQQPEQYDFNAPDAAPNAYYPPPQPQPQYDFNAPDAAPNVAPFTPSYQPPYQPPQPYGQSYDEGFQPASGGYSSGGGGGDVFSRFGQAANRGLSAIGQAQIDESQRAQAQGQAVSGIGSAIKEIQQTSRWADPQTYKDWTNTLLKYAAEENVRYLSGKPSEARIADIALLAPPPVVVGNPFVERATAPANAVFGIPGFIGGAAVGALEMTPLKKNLEDAPLAVKVGVGIMVAGATFAATKNVARSLQELEGILGPTITTTLARALPWAAPLAGAYGTVAPYEAIEAVVGVGSIALAQKAGEIFKELGPAVRFLRSRNPAYRATAEGAAAAEPEYIDVYLDPTDGVYKIVKDFVSKSERSAQLYPGSKSGPIGGGAIRMEAEGGQARIFSDPRDPNIARPRSTLAGIEKYISNSGKDDFIYGEVNGLPVWSNGFIAVIGETRPSTIKGANRKAPTDSKALEALINSADKNPSTLVPVAREEVYKSGSGMNPSGIEQDVTYMRNTADQSLMPVDTDYLYYFTKRFGLDLTYQHGGGADSPIVVVMAGQKVGLLMPAKATPIERAPGVERAVVQFDEAGVSAPRGKAPKSYTNPAIREYEAALRQGNAGEAETFAEGERRKKLTAAAQAETGRSATYLGTTGEIRLGQSFEEKRLIEEADRIGSVGTYLKGDDSALERAVAERVSRASASYTYDAEGKAARASATDAARTKLIADRAVYEAAIGKPATPTAVPLTGSELEAALQQQRAEMRATEQRIAAENAAAAEAAPAAAETAAAVVPAPPPVAPAPRRGPTPQVPGGGARDMRAAPEVVAPPTMVAPPPAPDAATAARARGEINLSGMAEAMIDNYYERIWEHARTGKTVLDFGSKSPLDQQIVEVANARGLIQSVDDVRRFAAMSATEASEFFNTPRPAASPPGAVPPGGGALPSHGLKNAEAQPGQWVWDGKKAVEVVDSGFWISESQGTNLTLADGSTWPSSAPLRAATIAEKNAAEEAAMLARINARTAPAARPPGAVPPGGGGAELPGTPPRPPVGPPAGGALPPLSLPKFGADGLNTETVVLYHGTSQRAADAILRSGEIIGGYATEQPGIARSFAAQTVGEPASAGTRENAAVLRVEMPPGTVARPYGGPGGGDGLEIVGKPSRMSLAEQIPQGTRTQLSPEWEAHLQGIRDQVAREAAPRSTTRIDINGNVTNLENGSVVTPAARPPGAVPPGGAPELPGTPPRPPVGPPGAVPPGGGGGTVPPAGSGAPPPTPPSPPAPPSGSTAPEPVQRLVDLLVPGEKPGLGILRLYEGAINTQGLAIRRDLNAGNRSLARLKIGRPTAQSRLVQKSPEIEQLFLALHGEGQVPPRLQGVFDTLKGQVDAETAATVGFDPKFMAHPDYFPRGWRTIEVEPANASRAQNMSTGSFGATPGFAKPRVDATFTEILGNTYTRTNGSVYRLEPQSWNPFEQMALRRVAGTEFREQSILIDRLKQSGTALVADGPLPDGYRVPRVGPAFEGKPKIAPGVDGQPASFYGYTDRYAVEEKIANVLENIYGGRVNWGRWPEAILSVLQGGKRAKLMGSLFQQVDFSTRTGFASFGGAVDDLISGKPISAVIKVAKLPIEIGKIIAANLSPARRDLLRNEILSGNAIFPDRPGITLKGVSEAGWNQADITMVRRDIKQAFTDSVGDESLTGSAMRNLRRLEAANQRGLFDGVYPQAQTSALKNWILPRLMRQHPNWTDAQIMGQAADEINKAFSTLGDYQTIFNNPNIRHLTHNLIFSTGEPEALIRGAGSMFYGNNKRLWITYYLGGFLFLAATANLIHMASTALMDKMETLPVMRYKPLLIDQNAPFGIKYNTRFLTPDTTIPGEGGVRTVLDLVGQMDTALRLLNPVEFATSRLNVGPRAIQNQISGTDYYGNRIDTVGPKGIVSRAMQFATDLYEPITVNQIRTLAISPKGIRESVGRIGGAVQAAGFNLRAESPAAAVDRGDFESLSGEAQLQGLRRKTWNEVKYLEGEDAPASFYAWYKKESEAQIERFSEYGFNPLQALDLAEKNMQKNDLAKLYRAKHNKAEDEWAIMNPKLAYEILLREKDLKFYEKTFSPSPKVKAYVGFASQTSAR